MSEESLITTPPAEAAPETSTGETTAPAETTSEVMNESTPDTESKSPKYAPFDPKGIPAKFIDKETGEIDITALTKSYTEMEKKLGSNPVPDDYEFDFVLQDSNLVWISEDQPKEVSELFKKAKISKEAAHELLKYHGKTMQAVVGKFGPPVDIAAERETLSTKWGEDFDSNMATVSKYASNLSPAVRNPLSKTAEGMAVLLQLAKQSRVITSIGAAA